jgi:hypothetical protein
VTAASALALDNEKRFTYDKAHRMAKPQVDASVPGDLVVAMVSLRSTDVAKFRDYRIETELSLAGFHSGL